LRDNPDRPEIVGDLRAGESPRSSAVSRSSKNVVTAADMATILEEMGPVHDGASDRSGEADGAAGQSTEGPSRALAKQGRVEQRRTTTKHLYLMLETGVIGGVCSGIAAYTDRDVTLVRVAVTLAALFEIGFLHTPLVVIAYIVLMFVIPVADTSEERARHAGIPFNAQQLNRRGQAQVRTDRPARLASHATRMETATRVGAEVHAADARNFTFTWPPPSPGSYGLAGRGRFMTPILTLASVAAFWAMVYAAVSLASRAPCTVGSCPRRCRLAWPGVAAFPV
jgi:phage shock protein PspC (stress-responsive transcriptional regulator)